MNSCQKTFLLERMIMLSNMTSTFGFLQFTILLSALCLSSVQTDCPSLNSERNSFSINSDVTYDYLLAHSTFLVTTTFNEVECFKQCLQNCSCLSMNYLKGGQPNNCLLNNSTKAMNPELLQFRASWKYYHFVRENTGNSDSNCFNTCCENNPCLHGSTCTELCANQRRRFQCKCKGLYTGHRCEIFKPRTCADIQKHGITKNGWNNIYITPNKPGTPVYCDFMSPDNITWTLTSSYESWLYKIGLFICQNRKLHYSHFYYHNLDSLERRVLRNQSTHWRATCEYDKHHRILDNYIVAKFDQIDLTASSWPDNVRLCKRFEVINVMNTTCTNCTATVLRDCRRSIESQYFLLLGRYSKIPSCTENVTLNERYFGTRYYRYYDPDNSLKINPLSPCNQYQNSTIQFWFGSV